MEIFLNGEIVTTENKLSIDALVNDLALAGKRIAVEVNEQIIPKSQHAAYSLKSGDKVEIVNAIGGG